MKILAKALKLVIKPTALAIKGAVLTGTKITPPFLVAKLSLLLLKELAANSKNTLDDKAIAIIENHLKPKK